MCQSGSWDCHYLANSLNNSSVYLPFKALFNYVIEFPLQQHFEFLCIINLLNVAKQGDDNKAHIE
jgi:hypothetical protein